MADAELLVDLDSGRLSTTIGLGSPIDAAELEDLRWYLEDYLQTPFGVYSDRGSRIAGQLADWGRALFDSVLEAVRVGREDADFPVRGLSEIVVRSEIPERLGLPWELMRAPGASVPLVLDGIGVTRCLVAKSPDDSVDAAGDRLRVLMVISRPASVRDVGYQMIARPLLRSMALAHGEVDLEVLRPPTLEALAARLRGAREAGAPFQVVHFDGHGATDRGALAFERPGGGADYVPAGRLAGVLAAADVPVAVLNACQSGAIGKRLEAAVATGLVLGGVDAVVAMSYRVYAVAAAEFMTAFYGQLLTGGTISEAVRAGRSRMAQHPGRPSPKGELPLEDWAVPVYYRRREVRFPQLRAVPPVSGGGPDRDELKSEAEFVGRDDLFCTLEMAARTDRVLVLHGPGGTGKTELAKAFGRWWRDTGGVDRPDGVFWHSFEPGVPSLGLGGAIRETGLRLYGPEFALRDPAARRDLVLEQLRARRLLLIWDNFESVATMPGDVASPLDETACVELKDFLREAAHGQSTILVTSRTPESWLGDVRRLAVEGMLPHEAIEYADQVLAPFPAAAGRRADRSFGELLEWLEGHPLSMRLILPHLATTEPAALLAGLHGTQPLPIAEEGAAAGENARTRSLTASVGYSVVHLSPAARRLLVGLSLLRGVADAEILGAFSAQADTPQRFRGVSADEWDMVLDEAARLGLLTTRADGGYGIHPALPAYLAAQWQAEEPMIYPGARAAADSALLAAWAAACQLWGKTMVAEASAEAYAFIDRNRRTMGRMLGYALDNRRWAAAEPIYITLYQYLDHSGLAEEARGWSDRARRAVEGPGGALSAGKLPTLRLEDLRDPRALSPAKLAEYRSVLSLWRAVLPALALWNVVVMSQANTLTRAGDLDAAEARYQEILQVQENTPGLSPAARALTYGKLGFVAEERGRFARADEMYRRALVIQEEGGDRQGIAQSLRHLGSVALDQGRWDEAAQHYRRSLAILKETPGDLHSTQLVYGKLGDLALLRGHLDEAEDWHAESLALAEQRHDWDGMARSLHSLGMLSFKRGQLAEAERWYLRCLAAAERVRDRPGMAAVYHQLGMVALRRGQDESREWFRRSLALHDELGDRSGVARDHRMLGMTAIAGGQADEAKRLLLESLAAVVDIGEQKSIIECYHLLGMLAHQQGWWDEAERWLRKCLALEEKMGHEAGVAVCCLQLGVLAQARNDDARALGWTVRALAVARRFPQLAVRLASGPVLSTVTSRLGIGAVEECWERVTGESLPGDVRLLALEHAHDEPLADR
ncbi:Tetratricopeptide TPR_2 repeat protein [Parafrankia sp. EAN1pec]|uniref:tetratricopeptide repeat protein n=1 Tax=Parafrankia sp. (strain EAN1pec) TaxID=298653 RepID=UPI00005437E4|nr:Tetratricopeptide TPR_2 repeat protein [Frankia sp. EAN1pec]